VRADLVKLPNFGDSIMAVSGQQSSICRSRLSHNRVKEFIYLNLSQKIIQASKRTFMNFIFFPRKLEGNFLSKIKEASCKTFFL
jgi:hypothetical protein